MACKRSPVRPRYSPPRRQHFGCRFFCLLHNTNRWPISLPFQREVWRVCLYLVCAIHIAHRFDPGILHQGDNISVVAFFVSCTTRNKEKGATTLLLFLLVLNTITSPQRPPPNGYRSRRLPPSRGNVPARHRTASAYPTSPNVAGSA